MQKHSTLLVPFFESLARWCDIRVLEAAAARVHYKYMESMFQPLEGMPEHVAYALSRMPASFAVSLRVFSRMQEVVPLFSPSSVLDIGCGPGTAIVTSCLAFPSINTGIGLERSKEFCDIFNTLFSHLQSISSSCKVIRHNLESETTIDSVCDLMTSVYAIGELSLKAQDRWLEFAQRRSKVLVLIEPGTPNGWKCLMRCRERLLTLGAQILAPCPHDKECPFTGTDAWCHESVRLQRTALHRRLKSGQLGYEDEKFSYLAVTFDFQLPCIVPPGRIVHAPRHRHGHTHLVLCTLRGRLEPTIISKKCKYLYPIVRAARWGDSLPQLKEEKA